ncbi:hypothetical protein C8R45DRAFT_1082590 [Mycena sanguinolenta]|nr:hypothetical protein C8R45DRAFT_1082590 [Mycena sanguinolenta]
MLAYASKTHSSIQRHRGTSRILVNAGNKKRNRSFLPTYAGFKQFSDRKKHCCPYWDVAPRRHRNSDAEPDEDVRRGCSGQATAERETAIQSEVTKEWDVTRRGARSRQSRDIADRKASRNAAKKKIRRRAKKGATKQRRGEKEETWQKGRKEKNKTDASCVTQRKYLADSRSFVTNRSTARETLHARPVNDTIRKSLFGDRIYRQIQEQELRAVE